VGVRYSFPYHATARSDIYGHAAAGKIMALAGLADDHFAASPEIGAIVDRMLDSRLTSGSGRVALNADWRWLYQTFKKFRNLSVTDPQFVAICKALQNGVYERFRRFAESHMRERLPLLISGGCGLNCDWNTMWRNSGLFESVFVPPVTNDTGIAIGAAATVQHMQTGKMKLRWDVYAGEAFVREEVDFAAAGFVEMDLNLDTVADWLLDRNMVIAWIQGRYEIGPRALCHRSLLAAPFASRTQDELNRIKNREKFRPVAPVCLEEDVSKHFEWSGPSPHMLYFQRVRAKELQAVTHADGTARVQTIARNQDSATHALLERCRQKSGYGVLCNTSLNFLGCGFINRTTDIVRYAQQTNLPAFVIGNKMYIARNKVIPNDSDC
jgi:hydroxymethyl cephem carbamoyltransferase